MSDNKQIKKRSSIEPDSKIEKIVQIYDENANIENLPKKEHEFPSKLNKLFEVNEQKPKEDNIDFNKENVLTLNEKAVEKLQITEKIHNIEENLVSEVKQVDSIPGLPAKKQKKHKDNQKLLNENISDASALKIEEEQRFKSINNITSSSEDTLNLPKEVTKPEIKYEEIKAVNPIDEKIAHREKNSDLRLLDLSNKVDKETSTNKIFKALEKQNSRSNQIIQKPDVNINKLNF